MAPSFLQAQRSEEELTQEQSQLSDIEVETKIV